MSHDRNASALGYLNARVARTAGPCHDFRHDALSAADMISLPSAFLPGLDLSVLPEVRALRVVYRAECAQRLPRLPSNALRGAFGHVVRAVGDHALSRLLEVEADGVEAPLESVTDRGPAAILLSGPFSSGRSGILLKAGSAVTFEVTLVGAAVAQEGLVLSGLRRAGEVGIGTAADDTPGPGCERPPLRLVQVEPVQWALPPSSEWFLDLTTPLVIRVRGREILAPDEDMLWQSMLRRAENLARAHGGGPICLRRIEVPRPFTAIWDASQPANVHRLSARQKRRMTWRGTMGVLRLRTTSGADLRPLLTFLRGVGIGKGTPQGLGRFELIPLHD